MVMKLKNALLWLFLLTKRLYKKPTFLVILVLIPALVFGYGMVAREDSGVLHIALGTHDRESPFAKQVMESLSESKILFFHLCDTPEQAKELVETGKADAAWILLDNLEQRVGKFVQQPQRKNAFVQVIEREKTVPLMLVREKLSGTLFACYSPQYYLHYIRTECPELDQVSDGELLSYYHSFSLNGKLFEFALMDGSNADALLEQTNYLVAPVRGMLAVVVVLCGLAGAMYQMQDEKRGTFSWMPERRKPLVRLACQSICVFNVALAMLIALTLFGVTEHWLREGLTLVLYVLSVCGFCMLMGRLCGNLRSLGMWTPILVVVMLVVCPVFFDLGYFRQLQLLFPPTYYVNAIYSDRFLLRMALYALICLGLDYLLSLRPKH